jgi:hypothetical protein
LRWFGAVLELVILLIKSYIPKTASKARMQAHQREEIHGRGAWTLHAHIRRKRLWESKPS